MQTYDVQSIDLGVSLERAFEFIADPRLLPVWTHAFESIDGDRATLRTPAGSAEIGLEVHADPATGTIDWELAFADGTVERACSRLVPVRDGSCIYSFVLQPPTEILEKLEGGLETQSGILAGELQRLKAVLENEHS